MKENCMLNVKSILNTISTYDCSDYIRLLSRQILHSVAHTYDYSARSLERANYKNCNVLCILHAELVI